MEKTFKELIDRNRIDIDFVPHLYIPIGRVESLLQLVREATITECMEVVEKDYLQSSSENMRTLPTDRIKLTEN